MILLMCFVLKLTKIGQQAQGERGSLRFLNSVKSSTSVGQFPVLFTGTRSTQPYQAGLRLEIAAPRRAAISRRAGAREGAVECGCSVGYDRNRAYGHTFAHRACVAIGARALGTIETAQTPATWSHTFAHRACVFYRCFSLCVCVCACVVSAVVVVARVCWGSPSSDGATILSQAPFFVPGDGCCLPSPSCG